MPVMVVELEPDYPICVGPSADLSGLYVPGEPGTECLVARNTYLNKWSLSHIARDHPERRAWVDRNQELIGRAVQQPDIVYRHLEYKDRMGHWTQACVIRQLTQDRKYLVVAISLARVDGDEADAHQIVTVYPAKERDFYRTSPDGIIEIKDRWMEVAKIKEPD
jgi:hypothetical protein